jgi:hypothetical protein
VGASLANDFLPTAHVHVDCGLVAHRSRRHKQRRFTPKDLSCALFQGVDGGILVIAIVANFRFMHSTPHRLRGPRDRIAPQIYDGGVHPKGRCNRRQKAVEIITKPTPQFALLTSCSRKIVHHERLDQLGNVFRHPSGYRPESNRFRSFCNLASSALGVTISHS